MDIGRLNMSARYYKIEMNDVSKEMDLDIIKQNSQVKRVISDRLSKDSMGDVVPEYLVKWRGLSYAEATWLANILEIAVKEIWRKILEWIGFIRRLVCWEDEVSWIIQQTKHNGARSQILKVVAAETIYCLWRNRNASIFGDKILAESQLTTAA